MTNSQSIINFAYFTANFPHNFIEKCWENDSYLINHLHDKLITKAENGMISCGSFIRWFFELDRENQIQLTEWINTNYKGISF